MTVSPDKYRGTAIYRYVYTELTLAARYRVNYSGKAATQ